MSTRLFSVFLVPALLLTAAKKPSGSGRGENQDFILTATLHVDPANIKELLGSDLGGHYMVAEVKIEPKYGKEVDIDRDDFQLRSDNDGEKAKPYVATQIAGQDALVITERPGEGKPGGGGWTLGGGPVVMGKGRGDANQGPEKVEMKSEEKANPLVKVLDDRMLKNAKTDKPISGLLYFAMEKQKLKDLELIYGTGENRIAVRFK